MQSKLVALIMACGMTFAALPLCAQAVYTENTSDTAVYEEYGTAELAAMFEGEGTEENPYILSGTNDFTKLAVMVNTGNPTYNSAYYKLNNSIDFTNVKNYLPIGKITTKLDYPGEGDFAPYKAGSYSLSSSVDASISTANGTVDVGSLIFSGASVTIEKSGKATLKLNFYANSVQLDDETEATFFVSDTYGDNGIATAGSIGYMKNDGTWVYYGSSDSDKVTVTRSGSSDTVTPSYTLDEGQSGVRYITQISFPLDVKKSAYSLALTVDSDICGAQLGGETENPVTLNIDWSAFSAPVYSTSEYVEKITAKYPFSGHFDGNGYSLKNITINSTERLIGIFGLGYNASVENLRVENLTINANRDYTMHIGGLFGCYEGNWQSDNLHITGCHIDGKINADCEKNAYTGGLIGVHDVSLNAAVVKDCRVDVDIVSVSGTTSYVGGMIGTIETGIDLSKCVVTGYAYGEAEGDANPYTGGIAARIVYDDWIGTTLGYEEASLMAQSGYSSASGLVSSIEILSVGQYRPLIGNTFAKVLEATVENCYYDSAYTVSGTLASYTGTAMSESELFDKGFLSDTIGLDFDNTWTMVLGKPDLITKDAYIAYEYDNAECKYNVQPVNIGSCTVYAAAYDADGRVLCSRIAKYTEGTPAEITFGDAEYSYVKLFAFDNDLSPLCSARVIE